MISRKYTSLYIASNKKQLKKLNEIILSLVKKPDSNILIENMFRLIHSMKGGAATMSFKKTVEFLHTLEDIVEAVYNGSLKLNRKILDTFFDTVEVLRRNLESIGKNGRQIALDKQMAVLRTCFRGQRKNASVRQKANLSQKKTILNDLHIDAEIAVSTDHLNTLQNLCDDLLIGVMQTKNLAKKQGLADILSLSVETDTTVNNLRRELEKLRIVPLSDIFSSLPYLVRDIAREQGKTVALDLEDNDLSLDKAILDELIEIIIQLLKNAVSHGIGLNQKNGRITLRAALVDDSMELLISDNGRGINWRDIVAKAVNNKIISAARSKKISRKELDDLIFMSGISATENTDFVSGRGIGLSLVKDRVQALGGKIKVTSLPGKGTTFVVTIPLPLSIFRSLVLRLGPYQLAMPLFHVTSVVRPDKLINLEEQKWFTSGYHKYRILSLTKKLSLRSLKPLSKYVALMDYNGKHLALPIASNIQERELVMKKTPAALKRLDYIKGVGVTSDGQPILILDISQLSQ
ncbi:MAG: hypothetical protein C3F02_00225 [Parcubacteria group bacterium]|nr:MAG: hypothetical protein C3F02_00225 [Parcubacteria group bacterium]